jgi:EAL domain-containing protein (putative c-di-GMP-specific phosphodiesterase class I)
MIELTHALGLKVIAEGVENFEQLNRLRQMNCDLAQGNYFSEPLPSEALAVVLEQNLTD